jgi:diguanylate cyclase (GGDEF)-like protein
VRARLSEQRTGEARGSRLFLVYALASLIPILILGFALVRNQQRTGKEWALTQGREQAAVIEQTAIAPALSSGDLRNGLNAKERASVQHATDLAVFSGSVSRLRLCSFSGATVFSDDGSTLNALPTDDPAFLAAAGGKTSARLVPDPSGGRGRVIQVVQPVVPNSTGQASGVMEIYLPYAEIAASNRAHLHTIYLRLVIGLGALYSVLALISWSTTRRLRLHAAQRDHEALHDPLTGLGNREFFRIEAEAAMRRAGRGERGALVLVDLDHFKEVNDTLGHHAGDMLLTVVARRLIGALRTDDLVARLGGDEFGILLPGLTNSTDALQLVRSLAGELNEEVVVHGATLRVEASFGIVMYPDHGDTVELLLQRADSAMYQGKRGAERVVVFSEGTAGPASHGLLLQPELRRAISDDELVLHYQPKIDLSNGELTGVEALVRWQHPDRGLLAPIEFIPAAEQSGLIEPLTDWVMRRALADRMEWRSRGADWPVSVNISARSLSSPTFAGRVRDLLIELEADPCGLCLEVTETALVGDTKQAVAAILELSRLGIRMSIDDFGTGYTSLLQLRTIHVDEVKIDRAFVSGVTTSAADRAIVQAMINLSHGLGCTVTAEGVETTETAHWLRSVGCDTAQGYHFARPGPWPSLLRNCRTVSLT